MADTAELVERAENAFKVTDGIYLGRVYTDTTRLFRVLDIAPALLRG